MFFYPSQESKTDYRFQPWMGLFIGAIFLAGYLLVTVPHKEDFRESRKVAWENFMTMLDLSQKMGHLRESFLIKAQQEPRLVLDPEYGDIYTPQVRRAYERYLDTPRPLTTLITDGGWRRHLLTIAPHHGGLLIVGVVALWLMAFVFEHVYPRTALLLLFVFISNSLILAVPHIPPPYRPSLLFCWAYSLAILLVVCWLTSPKARISLSFVTWFISAKEFRLLLPSLLPPAAFIAALAFIGYFNAEFKPLFEPLSLSVIPAFGLLFTLFLLPLGQRDRSRDQSPEQKVNRLLAQIESHFDEDRNQEALALLEEALDLNPTPEQHQRIADLAWGHHHGELAHSSYNVLYREALHTKSPEKLLQVVEEMLFREIPIPTGSLLSAVNLALKNGKLPVVRKFLPFLENQGEVKAETLLEIRENLAEKMCRIALPDKLFLFELKEWFERHQPQSKALADINRFFKKSAEISEDHLGFGQRPSLIHRFLDIKLAEVTFHHLVIQVKDGKQQRVPWSAVLGLFGCKTILDPKGFRGALLIKFKQKVFACQFGGADILMEDALNETFPFRKIWDMLKEYIPEDLPAMALEDFENIPDEKEFRLKVVQFLQASD